MPASAGQMLGSSVVSKSAFDKESVAIFGTGHWTKGAGTTLQVDCACETAAGDSSKHHAAGVQGVVGQSNEYDMLPSSVLHGLRHALRPKCTDVCRLIGVSIFGISARHESFSIMASPSNSPRTTQSHALTLTLSAYRYVADVARHSLLSSCGHMLETSLGQ
jgi:hypothetical protein